MKTISTHPRQKPPEKTKNIRRSKPNRKEGEIPADRGDREVHSKSEGSE